MAKYILKAPLETEYESRKVYDSDGTEYIYPYYILPNGRELPGYFFDELFMLEGRTK